MFVFDTGYINAYVRHKLYQCLCSVQTILTLKLDTSYTNVKYILYKSKTVGYNNHNQLFFA